MKLRALTLLVATGLLYTNLCAAQTSNNTAPIPTQQPAAIITHPTPKITTSANMTEQQKVSYSIGVDLGMNFKMQKIAIDPNMLARGLVDALSGAPTLLTPQQMATTLVAFQKELIAKRQAEFAAISQQNQQEGEKFLAANKTKPGVVTTPTDLQYKVIIAGKGKSPTNNDIVTVDYTGTLINGKIFDSSYQRGKPVTFQVSEVIPGWTEILKLMKPGATYEVYIPYNLAYGERGLGNVIGPRQTLIFKIHLLSVKSAGKNQTAMNH